MNTQELRRLGVLPYEEDDRPRRRGGWDSGFVRHGTWDNTMNEAVERMSTEIMTEIDNEVLEQMRGDEPVNETVIEPVTEEQVGIMRRILARFGR